MSFLDRLNTPKNYPFDRTDGYYHFSLGRMRSAPLDDSRNFIISVTTIDEIPEQKIQEVFDRLPIGSAHLTGSGSTPRKATWVGSSVQRCWQRALANLHTTFPVITTR